MVNTSTEQRSVVKKNGMTDPLNINSETLNGLGRLELERAPHTADMYLFLREC